jgi:hypothetical protein
LVRPVGPRPGRVVIFFDTFPADTFTYPLLLMQRLTVAGRLLITALILGLLYLGFRYFGGEKLLSGGQTATSQTSTRPDSPSLPGADATTSTGSDNVATDNGTGTTTADATAGSPSAFVYTAPEPVNGKLKGVVELGASGFNSFIVRIDGQKRWKLEKADFGNSLVLENMASDFDIREGLKKYIAGMLDFGVGGRDIHFVVSSGAQMAEGTQKIIKGLKSLNYTVNAVTPEQEGRLGLRCVLPADYADRAFVTDIGSGNTKISWMAGGQAQAAETYGAKYFQDNTPDETVSADVSKKVGQVPTDRRGTCFIIGGIPFELAKQSRVGKERYTVLKAPAEYAGKNAKQKSGLVIYKAIAETTGCRQFIFDWDANFTIGFLLALKS